MSCRISLDEIAWRLGPPQQPPQPFVPTIRVSFKLQLVTGRQLTPFMKTRLDVLNLAIANVFSLILLETHGLPVGPHSVLNVLRIRVFEIYSLE